MKIKFSHTYLKFPRDYQKSMLVDVIPLDLGSLSGFFLEYDTTYEENGEIKHYSLPATGAYMILMLQAGSGKGQLWTTIRSQWPASKLEYYKSHIGEVFDCEVFDV